MEILSRAWQGKPLSLYSGQRDRAATTTITTNNNNGNTLSIYGVAGLISKCLTYV